MVLDLDMDNREGGGIGNVHISTIVTPWNMLVTARPLCKSVSYTIIRASTVT